MNTKDNALLSGGGKFEHLRFTVLTHDSQDGIVDGGWGFTPEEAAANVLSVGDHYHTELQ